MTEHIVVCVCVCVCVCVVNQPACLSTCQDNLSTHLFDVAQFSLLYLFHVEEITAGVRFDGN